MTKTQKKNYTRWKKQICIMFEIVRKKITKCDLKIKKELLRILAKRERENTSKRKSSAFWHLEGEVVLDGWTGSWQKLIAFKIYNQLHVINKWEKY